MLAYTFRRLVHYHHGRKLDSRPADESTHLIYKLEAEESGTGSGMSF